MEGRHVAVDLPSSLPFTPDGCFGGFVDGSAIQIDYRPRNGYSRHGGFKQVVLVQKSTCDYHI
jgi:hypothetical protein